MVMRRLYLELATFRCSSGSYVEDRNAFLEHSSFVTNHGDIQLRPRGMASRYADLELFKMRPT